MSVRADPIGSTIAQLDAAHMLRVHRALALFLGAAS